MAAYKLIDRFVELRILREITGRSYNNVFVTEAIVSATLSEDE